MSKFVILGGTGLIGRHLCRTLCAQGHDVVVLSRSKKLAEGGGSGDHKLWIIPYPNPSQEQDFRAALELMEGAKAFINLAGENLSEHRWNDAQKSKITESRLSATRVGIALMKQLKTRPEALINASAIGYYGTSEDKEFTESSPPGSDFLARLCVQWEEEALKARESGARVVLLRTGIVLTPEGGALSKMLPIFKAGGGGPIASGNQWMSWIHIADEVGLIVHCLNTALINGPINLVSPKPVINGEFARILAKVLKRPAAMRVPAVALKMALGEMSILVVEGQKVLPKVALDSGYKFLFTDLENALGSLLGGK